MWSRRWAPDGRSIAGLSANSSTLMLYDFRTRARTGLYNVSGCGCPTWSTDAQLYFRTNSEFGIWRVRFRDRKAERVTFFDADLVYATDDTLILARSAARSQVYALEWELRENESGSPR